MSAVRCDILDWREARGNRQVEACFAVSFAWTRRCSRRKSTRSPVSMEIQQMKMLDALLGAFSFETYQKALRQRRERRTDNDQPPGADSRLNVEQSHEE